MKKIIIYIIEGVSAIIVSLLGMLFSLFVILLTFIGCSSVLWIPAVLIYLLLK